MTGLGPASSWAPTIVLSRSYTPVVPERDRTAAYESRRYRIERPKRQSVGESPRRTSVHFCKSDGRLSFASPVNLIRLL